jgi:predicted DNA-binding transcriptional regulator YafY
MRADRLLALLMLLQERGRSTAGQLARELEVSVRTVYRDLDALSGMGVPVYAERGPGGGCGLLEGYRTTLTGLTHDEARALFMLSIPAPLAQLGVSDELRRALLKLSAALPAGRRDEPERARQRIYVDSVAWQQGVEAVPHLQTLQRAVWEDRRLWVNYRLPFDTESERVVAPLGLVAKAGVWHLVYERDGALRVLRVADVLDARLAEGACERPATFDLAAFWNSWCARHEQARPSYPVTARLAPSLVASLGYYFGERAEGILACAGPPDSCGWITVTLPFETLYAARERILGMGGAVEVLEPLALRLSVADFARQSLSVYAVSYTAKLGA